MSLNGNTIPRGYPEALLKAMRRRMTNPVRLVHAYKGESDVRTQYCMTPHKYGSVLTMRRAEAILLIAVLLALPIALLGSGSPNGMCDGYCCLPHGHHMARIQMPTHSIGEEKASGGMACHRGALGHFSECSMKSNSRGMDYTILAPLPPTNLSASSALVLPVISRQVSLAIMQDSIPGFHSAPFEPPRA
jgi:hypothetical protein